MAATIAKATGIDKGREKNTHRLGHEAARTEAATWITAAIAEVRRDGSGYIEVRRNNELIHSFEFGPEVS